MHCSIKKEGNKDYFSFSCCNDRKIDIAQFNKRISFFLPLRSTTTMIFTKAIGWFLSEETKGEKQKISSQSPSVKFLKCSIDRIKFYANHRELLT